ncbi:hypothetical protein [Streptomyces sp. NPDC048637]|uniref:hypothetical protein n=1 Tax=Streptomyces sp. NPDC048637 TaxID=3155636 RepID=UPI0034358A0A
MIDSSETGYLLAVGWALLLVARERNGQQHPIPFPPGGGLRQPERTDRTFSRVRRAHSGTLGLFMEA